MKIKERFFHALLFEAGAILLTAIMVWLLGNHNPQTAWAIGLLLSLIAVLWSVVYNWGFDRVFTGQREARGWGVRLLHTLLFEIGLLAASLPLMMVLLNLTLWQAFWADIGLTLLIVCWSLFYNWVYDLIRAKIIKKEVFCE